MTTTPTGDAETIEGLRDHERIWLEPRSPDDRYGSDGRTWCQNKVWPEHEGQPEPTEYVRADIAAAELASLRESLAKAEGEREFLRECLAAQRERAAEYEALYDDMHNRFYDTEAADKADLQSQVAEAMVALGRVRAAIFDEVNGLAIQCTVFMPATGCPPHETMVDFIDAALASLGTKETEFEQCDRCGGTGLAADFLGEPTDCPACGGDTVTSKEPSDV